MYVAINCDVAFFRTKFNDTHDLVQKFRGVNNATLTYNAPVDFMEAGLIDNSKWDYWHVDIPFNYSNDEATPPLVNGTHIGANHGQPCAVIVFSENHGKSPADIGSIWQDEAGVKFTLIRLDDENSMQFVSENVGESECAYKFVKNVTGALKYISHGQNTADIKVEKQYCGYLSRSNKYTLKKIFTYKDGKWSPLFGGAECEMAEIREEYFVINPATVGDALRQNRPPNGYTDNVDLSHYGKAMVQIKNVYRVMPDGTILCMFDLEKLMDVHVLNHMGVMYQEKLDIYGGGVCRIIPKTKPIDCEEGVFDFTKPVALYGKPFPKRKNISPEYFENPDFPPDRVIDLFRDKEGKTKLGFACGYLPLFDCAPEIRKNNLASAVNIKFTRKVYPNAAYGDIDKLKGIAYKKFFAMAEENPVYTISHEGKTYIFANFIKAGKTTLPIDSRVKVIDKGGDVEWYQDCNSLTISGAEGTALFVTE